MRVDLTGQRFGKLVVVGPSHKRRFAGGGHQHWLCRCDCGRETTPSTGTLRYGSTRACSSGCGQKGKPKPKARKPEGHAARHQVYIQYRKRAAKKKLEFSISEHWFMLLSQSTCHYCGRRPSNLATTATGTYQYNGLDRVDNSKGYTLENVVPCCSVCNSFKSDFSSTEFLLHVKLIAEHHNKQCEDCFSR